MVPVLFGLLTLFVRMTLGLVPVLRHARRSSLISTTALSLSREQDLELTIEVIMKNARKIKKGNVQEIDSVDVQEQHQRALLLRQLQYRQVAGMRQERSLLQTRVWLDDRDHEQKQKTAASQSEIVSMEAKQRAILIQRLQLETMSRESKQTYDALGSHSTITLRQQKVAEREVSRQAEARQRALLTTQLQLLEQQKQNQYTVSWEENIISTVLHANVPALIRIACAYSESQEIRPGSVETASVLSITPDRMEIAMLVCEGEGCVNVAVPVPLPQSCRACTVSLQEMTTCMLGNLLTLDQIAHKRIEQAERSEVRHEELQQIDRLHCQLQAAPEFRQDLPDWWTTGDVEIQRECDVLKGILNEDEFINEIQLLAKQHLDRVPEWMSNPNNNPNNFPLVVKRAAVALVGSSGLFLRAQLCDRNGRTAIVPVPVPFHRGKVELVETLRSAVLELVDSVTGERTEGGS